MTCDECREAISRQEAGLADPQAQAQIDEHLANCKICQSTSGVFRRSLAVISTQKSMTRAPADLLELSWRRIEQEVRVSQPPVGGQSQVVQKRVASTSSWGRKVAIGILLVVVAAVAVVLVVQSRPDEKPPAPNASGQR